jgi:enoyl-CoA hydratase
MQLSQTEGVQAAIAQRDRPFGDYSQAPLEERPNPNNVIE